MQLPYLAIVGRIKFRRRRNVRELLRDPAPLARARSSLSKFTSNDQNQDNHHPALSSRLLQLPAEIRVCIWTYVLSDPSLPICLLPCEEQAQNRNNNSLLHDESSIRPKKLQKRRSIVKYKPSVAEYDGPYYILGLSKTCRQIYTETIDLAYSLNTFAMYDVSVFFAFIRSIPLERLAVIKSLSVTVQSNDHGGPSVTQYPGTWLLFCCTLETSMPGLRHLGLRLNDRIMDPSWVDHLLRVKQLTSFDLCSEAVAWNCLTRANGCLTIAGSFHEVEMDQRVNEVQCHIRQQLGIGGNDIPSAHEGFWFNSRRGWRPCYI